MINLCQTLYDIEKLFSNMIIIYMFSQQNMSVMFAPYSHQDIALSVFLTLVLLVDV